MNNKTFWPVKDWSHVSCPTKLKFSITASDDTMDVHSQGSVLISTECVAILKHSRENINDRWKHIYNKCWVDL